MKLRRLRVVMAVASRRSMTAAARSLNLSQPAVTRIVRLLEVELGAPLFERGQTGAEPTAAGVLLVEAGARAFRHLSEIELEDDDLPTHPDLSVRSAFTRQVADHELTALIAVETQGSLAYAAESLGVTQTALTRSLAALAARLARPLFRPGRTKRLTPWASDAARKARRALAEIASAEQSLRRGRTTERPPARVRVGALPASRVHLAPEAIRRFSMERTACEVSLVDARYETLLSNLRSGEVDLIIGSIRPRNLPSWTLAEPLFEDHLVVVSHPLHPLQRLSEVDWWDLRSARWVLPTKGTPIRTEFARLIAENGIPEPAQIVEVDSFIAARAFLLAGDWLGIFSASQIIPEERGELLRRLPMSSLGEARPVGVMTRRNERAPEDLARFLTHLRAVAEEVAADLADACGRQEGRLKLMAGDAN